MIFHFKSILPIFLLIISTQVIYAQAQEVMTPEVYKIWNRIGEETISKNGNYVYYTTNCETCDPTLFIYNRIKNTTLNFPRAKNPKFTPIEDFIIYTRIPDKDYIKMLKLAKTDKKDMPKDSMVMVNLANNYVKVFPHVDTYELPEEYGRYMIYKTEAFEEKIDTTSIKHKASVILYDYVNDISDTLQDVENYKLNPFYPNVLYNLSPKKDSITGIYNLNLVDQKVNTIMEGHHKLLNAAFGKDKKITALLTTSDTTQADHPDINLSYYDATNRLIQLDNADIPFHANDWKLSAKSLSWNEAGDRLYFGQIPPPLNPDSTLLDEERVQVEVWTTNDQLLYTQQENNLDQDKNKIYALLLNENGKVIPIDEKGRSYSTVDKTKNNRYGLEINSKPYLEYITWQGYGYQDVYLIDLLNGKKTKILERSPARPELSPDDKYIHWFDREKGAFHIYDISNQKVVRIITDKEINILDEEHDQPSYQWYYGEAGWTSSDKYLIVYDRYDIWLVDPTNASADMRLTKGRETKKTHRIIKLDKKSKSTELSKPIFTKIFDNLSKDEQYAYIDQNGKIEIIETGKGFRLDNSPSKSEENDWLLFTKQNYQTFPDLSLLELATRKEIQISEVNPQQKNYKWSTIELVKWTNEVGEELEGLLVKPKDFDPSKKYPLLVNFYERSSDGLHYHRAPYAHRSTINYTYYASKGYLVFNPNVTYKVGYPGQSCEEDVLSGVDYLISQGFVDKNKIGVQGHSWGGYQVAHLLTKTDIFKCAESGAPVVNMVSAYGGIRWGSGMSRMFQYEKTQSRLGATLWEKPNLYLENSPIFNMDKVNTPVLILHNDEDGAVPWYQGIEYFVAMKRLGKQAWFLNYNKEPHWPVKWENRLDFNIRMEQFFDHFLLDQPEPLWMKEGVSPVEKGIKQKIE